MIKGTIMLTFCFQGLRTSFGKKLPFDRELKGSAEIVTEDLRLIERFSIKLGNCWGIKLDVFFKKIIVNAKISYRNGNLRALLVQILNK